VVVDRHGTLTEAERPLGPGLSTRFLIKSNNSVRDAPFFATVFLKVLITALLIYQFPSSQEDKMVLL
jgi:hypothetical protein